MTELNLNNHTKLDSDLIEELVVALTDNIYLEKLQLANIRFTEDHAFVRPVVNSQCHTIYGKICVWCIRISHITHITTYKFVCIQVLTIC